jgi:hypothetical protein
MKKLFIIFASMFFMFACTQEKDSLLSENEKATAQIPELTTAEAQMKFAKLLSQAASNSVEVRKFLKNEATKQFDNVLRQYHHTRSCSKKIPHKRAHERKQITQL